MVKKDQKPRKKLLSSPNHQLLNIKEVLDTILKEAEGLQAEVKQAVIIARDASWQAFIKEQEKLHSAAH